MPALNHVLLNIFIKVEVFIYDINWLLNILLYFGLVGQIKLVMRIPPGKLLDSLENKINITMIGDLRGTISNSL
jgi:hypothetical protein